MRKEFVYKEKDRLTCILSFVKSRFFFNRILYSGLFLILLIVPLSYISSKGPEIVESDEAIEQEAKLVSTSQDPFLFSSSFPSEPKHASVYAGDFVLTADSKTKQWVVPSKLLQELPFGGIATRSSASSPEELLESRTTVINFCHPHWHGIRQATYGQKYPVLEIPGITSDNHERSLVNFLSYMHDLKTVIVNGIPPNTIAFAKVLKAKFPKLTILFIYHGSISQPFHEAEAGLVNDMIKASKEGIIERIGIVKNGMVEAFNAFGIYSVEIWNFPEITYQQRNVRTSIGNNRFKVGVFGSSWVHKNVFVQIVALCSMKDVDLHILKKPNIPYLEHCQAKIIEHGDFLEHNEFINLIAQMDLTLYVSLTECFPMTVVESISMGIPSLTSATSAIYSLDPVLEEYLVVNELDSPDYIAQKVRNVRKYYNDISLRLWQLLPFIEKKADRQFRVFVENATLPEVQSVNYKVPQVKKKDSLISRKPTILFVIERTLASDWYTADALITNVLIKDLLSDGYNVFVLNCGSGEFTSSFRKDLDKFAGKFTSFDLDSLSKNMQVGEDAVFQSMKKSIMIANALSIVYQRTPFDLVEFPDRGGLAYETLKFHGIKYLSKSVLIAIRIYGTFQVIETHSTAKHHLSVESKILYLQEQYCLLRSDLIFAQNPFQKNSLKLSYGIHPNLVHDSFFDMKSLVAEFDTVASMKSFSKSDRESHVFLVEISSNTYESLLKITDYIKFFLETNKNSWPSLRFVFVSIPHPTPDDFNDIHETIEMIQNAVPKAYLKYYEFHKEFLDLKTFKFMTQNIYGFISGYPVDELGLLTRLLIEMNVPAMLLDCSSWAELYDKYDSDFALSKFSDSSSFTDALSRLLNNRSTIKANKANLVTSEKKKEEQLFPYVYYQSTTSQQNVKLNKNGIEVNERADMIEKHIDIVLQERRVESIAKLAKDF